MSFDFKTIFSSLKKVPTLQTAKVVGIDFGSSSIKVVEIESKEGVLTLTTYGELQLAPYGEGQNLGSAVKLPLRKRVEAIVDVMRESGVTAKNAVLALPLADSFVTVMSLPAGATEDISPRVNVEARKYIPVPLTDVALEWSEIPQSEKDGAPALTREVLLVAIQNNALADMQSILNSIEMISKPSEIELFSTLRAVTSDTDTSLAVIDVGAQTSKLYVAEGGFLQRIHRVQTGGSSVTSAIANALKISFEDAENIKRNYEPTSQHAPVIKKTVTDTFERTLQEFKRVIGQHELRTGVPIARVTLTGGSSLFPEFRALASYALDREVTVSNPFTKIAYPAFMEDTLNDISPIFSVALGAALRQFEV
jgi:type IV pilus assembly protein PilM